MVVRGETRFSLKGGRLDKFEMGAVVAQPKHMTVNAYPGRPANERRASVFAQKKVKQTNR